MNYLQYTELFSIPNTLWSQGGSYTEVLLYLSIFYEVREHDHSTTLSVVDHLPHVPSSGLHWALSYDVNLLLLVALRVVMATWTVTAWRHGLTLAATAWM